VRLHNVGDQFTSKNSTSSSERSATSTWRSTPVVDLHLLLPVLLASTDGAAFGMPAAMMFFATLVFWLGRKKFAVVPPPARLAARRSLEGRPEDDRQPRHHLRLPRPWWALWNRVTARRGRSRRSPAHGQEPRFGGRSSRADPVVNGLFILALVPVFTFASTRSGQGHEGDALRKIAIGIFMISARTSSCRTSRLTSRRARP